MTRKQAEKIAEANKDIPTSEIEQDILDTQREIVQMDQEAKGFRMVGDRMSHFRADARISGIEKRKKFIEKLQAILDVRGVTP